MTQFFQFETDFVASLRCIPMQVRLKLDTCGVKLKLSQWNHFNGGDRQALVALPCETEVETTAYRKFVQQMIQERTGTTASELTVDPAPEWLDPMTIPDSVRVKTVEVSTALTQAQWAALTPLQRFALIKLSRSGHENSNFLPALKEFHLV